MKKHIYGEKNGLWYELHGNYYLPCLALPEDEDNPTVPRRSLCRCRQ